MLKQTLNSINETLDKLNEITLKDIKDIKQANHEALFERNSQKEELIKQFNNLKSEIDAILVNRNQTMPIEQILDEEESILLDAFKEKLNNFYETHKKFSKMALLVANFYNNLLQKITNAEVDIGYKVSPKNNPYSTFSLKG
ncbi:MAG: hypothetical protein DSY40_03155 [Nautilia sp.]|nr:MAG: hypothetical protein DSY40_03155 [Nautilia sp.]